MRYALYRTICTICNTELQWNNQRAEYRDITGGVSCPEHPMHGRHTVSR